LSFCLIFFGACEQKTEDDVRSKKNGKLPDIRYFHLASPINTSRHSTQIFHFSKFIHIREGVDKALAQPTSPCRRTESRVSLERGYVYVPNCKFFLLQRLKRSMSGDVRDFNNIETRAVIKNFFPARQGAEGNSRHSERNVRGTYIIVCHRPKLGDPV